MSFGSLAHSTRKKLLDSLGLEQKGSISAPDADMLALFGAIPSVTGKSVTPASAMQVPAVTAAVGLISDTVGTLPCKVFTRLPEGGKEPASKHAAYKLVHDDANDWTSASALRSQLTSDALLTGNGFAFANRVNGRVQEFLRLDPSIVTIDIDRASGEPSFIVKQASNKKSVLARQDVLHVAAFTSSDGVSGISPIYFAREAIAVALVLETHAARLFGRGGRPSGVLTFENKLDPETAKRIGESWHASHAGESAGKTAVLEQGGRFQPLTFSSVDVQFAEMRKFQILEIARAFRVAPQFLMELDRATWSNSEEMNRQFLQFTLLPWLRTWEASYRRVLLNSKDRETHSIEFIVDDLLRADTETRATAYGQFRSMGVMTANEIRKFENLPTLPGGDELSNPYITAAPVKSKDKPK